MVWEIPWKLGLWNSKTSGEVMNYFNEFTGVTRWRLVDYPGLSNLRIYIKHEWPRLSRENSHEPLIPRSRITRLNEAGPAP